MDLRKVETAVALVGSFAAVAIAVVAVVIAAGVGDPDPATVSDVHALEDELASLDRELGEVTDAAASSVSDVSAVENELEGVTRHLDELKARVRAKGDTIELLRGDVASLRAELQPDARSSRTAARPAREGARGEKLATTRP